MQEEVKQSCCNGIPVCLQMQLSSCFLTAFWGLGRCKMLGVRLRYCYCAFLRRGTYLDMMCYVWFLRFCNYLVNCFMPVAQASARSIHKFAFSRVPVPSSATVGEQQPTA